MPFGLPEINKILPTGYVLGEDLSYLEAQEKDDVKSAELVSGCLANLATLVSRIQVMPAMQEVCVVVWLFQLIIRVFKWIFSDITPMCLLVHLYQ